MTDESCRSFGTWIKSPDGIEMKENKVKNSIKRF